MDLHFADESRSDTEEDMCIYVDVENETQENQEYPGGWLFVSYDCKPLHFAHTYASMYRYGHIVAFHSRELLLARIHRGKN